MAELNPIMVRRAAIELTRNEFALFVWRVFETLHPHPEDQFVLAWHVQAMCHELDQVRRGENKRLVITIPPRCLKSITVAVAFAAFLLGHKPSTKIIVASYGLDLARKHSEDCRQVMSSAWYREMFPGTRLAARGNTTEELKTTAGGLRKAVSIGSSVTGHGADVIIIDDLLKAQDAHSEAELTRAQEFIEGTLLSRFNNPSEGCVVAIGQRLHEMDPPGYLLDKGNYSHLNLPAIAEEAQVIELGQGKVKERKPGDLLFPEHLGAETLDRMRKEMGSAVFNCQYQQNPIAPDGSALRWEWFNNYEFIEHRHWYQLVVQSWDTGTSAAPNSDFSVCTTWGFRDRCWYLLDVWRGQLDYPDLKAKTLQLVRDWDPDRVLIEDAATGRPLRSELFRDDKRYERVKPKDDKEIRFAAACAPVEEGIVCLPIEASWLPDFKRELQSFPRGRNDDQVDSFSQFLNWSKGTGFYRALARDHPINQERLNVRVRQRPRR